VSIQPLCTNDSRAVRTRPRRRLVLAATLTLVLAIPGTANSFTLDQLLDMPIEQLLKLEITSMHLPQVPARRPPSPNAPRAAEHRDAT